MRTSLLAVLLLGLAGGARASAPLRETAARVSAAARRGGAARVAVLAFEARGGGTRQEGEDLADLLTDELVRAGRVKVVERSRLAAVMSERSLGFSGATAAGGSDAPLAAADAVVAGSFERRGGEVRVSARLVLSRTGEILAATEETFDRAAADGEDALPDASWNLVVPPPAFTVAAPVISEDPVELRDAPNDDDCRSAGARVDAIVSGILELKARYWASEMRKGFSPYAITRNPGSEISDPALKDRFYDAMKVWFGKPFIPELSRAELARLRSEDARAAALAGRCGI
jgi:TolB-like protein